MTGIFLLFRVMSHVRLVRDTLFVDSVYSLLKKYVEHSQASPTQLTLFAASFVVNEKKALSKQKGRRRLPTVHRL